MADQLEANADWGRVFSETVALVRPLAGRDAEAIVDEAMVLLFAKRGPARAPGDTVAAHLAKVGLHAWRVRQRLDRKHRHPRGLGMLLRSHDIAAAASEDPASRVLDERRKARFFEELLGALGTDPEARDVALRLREGVTDAGDQAAALGVSVEEVMEARRRIKARMEAIMALDESRPPRVEHARAAVEESGQ